MDTQEDKPAIPIDNNNEETTNTTDINDNKNEKKETVESTSSEVVDKKSEKDNTSEDTDVKKNTDIKDGEKNSTSEVLDKKDKKDTEKSINDEIKNDEVKKDEIKKVDSYPSLSHKSSNSSISTPKSILRKRRTGGEDDDGSGESDTGSTSSNKRKHIEFSDDNIVYTLKQEDEYDYDDEDEEDDEAYKGHHPDFESETMVYTIFVFIKRYLLFALVIAAGFCFSYYSYNSNNSKKPHGKSRHGKIQGKNKPGPPSIQWDNIITQSSEEMKKTSLQRIDSITMSEILSANPTTTSTTVSVFQEESSSSSSSSTNVPGEQSKEEKNIKDTSSPVPESSKKEDEDDEKKDKKDTKDESPVSDSSNKVEEKEKEKIKKDKKSEEKKYKRVVAVGDIHGDYRKLIKVLRTAKLIDHKGNWIAKDTVLVQTGDLIDRGSDTILIFDLMIKLKEQAKKHDSIVYMLLGNHEVMNLQEDYRYVTRGDVMSFGNMANRKKEFSLQGKYGKLLRAEMNATMIVDDTLFVHAGLTSVYAKFGVEQMNNHVHYILQNYPPDQLFYAPIFGNNGPIWTRFMSMGQEVAMCEELKMVFEILNVKRMVVGHTVQENGKINTRCNNQYLMIDVGMSEFYGGGFAFLEILNDTNEVWAVYSDTSREKIN